MNAQLQNGVNSKDGIVLDEETMNAAYGGEITKEGLPDATKISSKIVEVMEYMTSDEMLNIRKHNKDAYEAKISNKFPLFYNNYYGIIQVLINGETNISHLIHMLNVINNVQLNKINIDDATNLVDDNLTENMVYPNLPKSQVKKMRKYKKNQRKR